MFTHCLRPVFTERLVQLLQRGRSINLVGAEGAGRERLLTDLQQCALPDTQKVLVNLKSYRESYDGCLRAIWTQFGQDGSPPESLSALIERCDGRSAQVWLLLDNFDALLDNPAVDPKYDTTFYDALNYCRNKPNIALICATAAPHDQSVVFVNGKPHSNSWLDLEQKPLPALTYEEIVLEVQRQPLGLALEEQSAVIAAVRAHAKPYKLLEYLREKLFNKEDGELPFHARLKKWLRQFPKTEQNSLIKWVHTVMQKIRMWCELTGITKLKAPFLLLGDIGKWIACVFGKGSDKE